MVLDPHAGAGLECIQKVHTSKIRYTLGRDIIAVDALVTLCTRDVIVALPCLPWPWLCPDGSTCLVPNVLADGVGNRRTWRQHGARDVE